MEKCLITGGAGFIGSHLVEACIEKGWRVLVIDDLSTGKKENLPRSQDRLEFIQGDIRDRQFLRNIMTLNPDVDYVFHLAAIASVIRSMEDPVLTHDVNYRGTLFLLECLRARTIKKFVYASSAAVYGDTQILPLKEEFPPKPQSPYGADKLAGEYILKIYNDSFQVPTVACRFFNVFGERQDPSSPYSGVISIFFDKAFGGKGGEDRFITIFGDGRQTRDFVYVKDVVSALLHLAQDEDTGGEVFNIGYGNRMSILDLASKVKALTDDSLETVFEKGRAGELRHSQADISKLKKTGFQFFYDFDRGLKRLAQWIEPQESHPDE
ncbi:MAG: NAD-dependent epimerase/dehydratase family protein [Desulfatiglandales bacterium]